MSVKPTVHIPVLLDEVVEWAQPENGGVYVDGTFGGGGYTKALLEAGATKVIAIDRDPKAIERGQSLATEFAGRLELVESRFSDLRKVLKEKKEESINGIVLDLGFSSDQLDDAERGFAFKCDGPLDMRMSPVGETAADVVNTYDEKELADIFYKFGEEKNSRRIARLIGEVRKESPFETTEDLARLVEKVNPKWKGGGRHPAMRVFQALRIHVNREMEELERVLPDALALLKPGGRLCIVTFHSLEDRLVKHFFRQHAGVKAAVNKYRPRETEKFRERETVPPGPRYILPVRKAIDPSMEEVARNSRARSAKLRVLERVA